jgi:hypothetical protein
LQLHWIKLVSISHLKFKCLCLIFLVPCKWLQKKCHFTQDLVAKNFEKKHVIFLGVVLTTQFWAVASCSNYARRSPNCLKGQGQKRNIAQPFTGRFRFQIWPTCHPEAGAAQGSTGARPVPPQKQIGISLSQPGALLPLPKVVVKEEPRAPGCPVVQLGNPGSPGDSRTPVLPLGGPKVRGSPRRSPPPRPHCLPRPAPGDTCACSFPSEESERWRRRGHRLELLRVGGGAHRPVGVLPEPRSHFAPHALCSPAPAGWGGRELGLDGVRVGLRWGWGGAGWGDACLLTKENEWDTLSRPAPLGGEQEGECRRGRGGPFIHSRPLGRRRSGRAGSRAPPPGEARGGRCGVGAEPRARVLRRRLRRHVSAGERKRGADSAGTGG